MNMKSAHIATNGGLVVNGREVFRVDVILPRTWVSPDFYIHTEEEESRIAPQYKDWWLTEDLMKRTNGARFIHVMPFDRGNEVEDSIVGGPDSLVNDQAENLPHIRKAFLSSVLVEVDTLEKLKKSQNRTSAHRLIALQLIEFSCTNFRGTGHHRILYPRVQGSRFR